MCARIVRVCVGVSSAVSDVEPVIIELIVCYSARTCRVVVVGYYARAVLYGCEMSACDSRTAHHCGALGTSLKWYLIACARHSFDQPHRRCVAMIC